MEDSQDRRRFPRFNLLVDVSVAKRATTQQEKILSTKNISQGGVCVLAYEEYKLGDLIDVKMHLPDVNEDVATIGKVVWIKEWVIGEGAKSKKYDVGIEFIGINDVLFDKINKYLFIRQEKGT